MAPLTGLTNATSPLIGEDLENADFKVVSGNVTVIQKDFWRSNPAFTQLPDGAADDPTQPILRTGFVGVGAGLPTFPFQVSNSYTNTVTGDLRPSNGTFVWLSADVSNAHQFCGMGLWSANQPFYNRFQTLSDSGGHVFAGGLSATASRRFATSKNRRFIVGDEAEALGTGTMQISTVDDDGSIALHAPDAYTAGQRKCCEILFDGWSGNGGNNWGAFEFRITKRGTINLAAVATIVEQGDYLINPSGEPIGSTTERTPVAALNVVGALRINGGPISPGDTVRKQGGLIFGAGTNQFAGGGIGDGDSGITSLADAQINIMINGGENYRFGAAGVCQKTGGGAWAVLSDRRVKDAIAPATQGLPELLDLNVVEFEYNGKHNTVADGRRYMGVMADEIAELHPDWLQNYEGELEGIPNDKPLQTVDPSDVTWMLVKAVQDLTEIVKSLEDRISALGA